MWIIQEPKKVELWNKRHFEKKNGMCAACLKYSILIFVEKKYIKCNICHSILIYCMLIMFICDPSRINGTLLEERWTFSALSWLPLERFSLKLMYPMLSVIQPTQIRCLYIGKYVFEIPTYCCISSCYKIIDCWQNNKKVNIISTI
jgi:hypothetical protein